MGSDVQRFRAALEAKHKFPGSYLFKFIVVRERLSDVQALFGEAEVSVRESAQGKYVACSIELEMQSSDQVIAIYQRASLIPSLIAL